MRKQLGQSARFLYSTLSIVPKGFYQLLKFLVSHLSAKTYQGSHTFISEEAFRSLRIICQGYKIDLRPEFVMALLNQV